jgi:dihydroorotate dehydrogenase electron transfer subunit
MTLEHIRRLTEDCSELVLSGDTGAMSRPGQFVDILLPNRFLRRPISVCSWSEGGLLLLVRAAGRGTRDLITSKPGTRFDVLTGLGNGFHWEEHGSRPVLIGGGIGLAPLYGLAIQMINAGLLPTVALGFRTASDVFYAEEFASLGCPLFLATEDGSLGTAGFVTECVQRFAPECDYAFACGPMPMLRSAAALPQLHAGGQFSFEARMACGFGACMGCSMELKSGWRRVCKDGPVFRKEELLW